MRYRATILSNAGAMSDFEDVTTLRESMIYRARFLSSRGDIEDFESRESPADLYLQIVRKFPGLAPASEIARGSGGTFTWPVELEPTNLLKQCASLSTAMWATGRNRYGDYHLEAIREPEILS